MMACQSLPGVICRVVELSGFFSISRQVPMQTLQNNRMPLDAQVQCLADCSQEAAYLRRVQCLLSDSYLNAATCYAV